ncbi:hypothetical protein ABW20_dc0108797 [Dactylellina cionopaga]|nr:hypothetical protein ABW20_dc0108797 [Dactylellina cionopaga]
MPPPQKSNQGELARRICDVATSSRPQIRSALIKWNLPHAFKWSLSGSLPGISRTDLMDAIGRALTKWGTVIDISSIRIEDATSSGPIELDIRIEGPEVSDPLFQPGWGTAGAASVGPEMCPASNNRVCGWIRVNNTKTKPRELNINMFHNTILHEFGHVLGLQHYPGRGAIMSSSTSEDYYTREQELTPIDIQNIRNLYSVPNQRRSIPYSRDNTGTKTRELRA